MREAPRSHQLQEKPATPTRLVEKDGLFVMPAIGRPITIAETQAAIDAACEERCDEIERAALGLQTGVRAKASEL